MNGIDAKQRLLDRLEAEVAVVEKHPDDMWPNYSVSKTLRAFFTAQGLPLKVRWVEYDANRKVVFVKLDQDEGKEDEAEECLAALQELLEGVVELELSEPVKNWTGTLTLTNEPALMYGFTTAPLHWVGSRAKVKPSHRPLPAHHALLKPRGAKGKPARW